MDRYDEAAAYADRIEGELRALNAWHSEPLPAAAFQSQQAFFADTMSFYQWLQFVLVARVRQIVEERGAFPRQSSVGAYAIRELDGYAAADPLLTALCDFDRFIETRAQTPDPAA